METPIETAQRVWPGEWSTIDLHFLRRRLTKGGPERPILPAIIEAHPSDLGSIWRVRLRSNGVGVEIGGPGPLAEALTTARQKMREVVKDLVQGVGGLDG